MLTSGFMLTICSPLNRAAIAVTGSHPVGVEVLQLIRTT